MGLLPTEVREEIETGNYRVAQQYHLHIPADAIWTGYEFKTIHNDDDGPTTITDHGVISREGYNQAMATPGSLKFGEYRFTAANIDGLFSPDSDLWVNSNTLYRADPTQCRVNRWTSIFVDGIAQTILETFYLGRISAVKYKYKTTGEPYSITFHCSPPDISKLSDVKWGTEDYDKLQIVDGGLTPITFEGPPPEDN